MDGALFLSVGLLASDTPVSCSRWICSSSVQRVCCCCLFQNVPHIVASYCRPHLLRALIVEEVHFWMEPFFFQSVYQRLIRQYRVPGGSSLHRFNEYVVAVYFKEYHYILVTAERCDGNMILAYQTLVDRLKEKGIHPEIHLIDNECSKEMRATITGNDMKYQLMPPE